MKFIFSFQPIFNNNKTVIGYDIYSASSENGKEQMDDENKNLFNILSNLDLQNTVKDKLGFIDCTLEGNSIEMFDLLKVNNIALSIKKPCNCDDYTLKDIALKSAVLKKKGYKISMGPYALVKGCEELLDIADFIQVDIKKYDPPLLSKIIEIINKKNKSIILQGIDEQCQYENFAKLNVTGLQGYFFQKPIMMEKSITNPSAVNLINLINMVIKEEDICKLEKFLKQDPILSFKLFKYINSYGISGGAKIDSVKSAIMILGYKNLLRWLTILFTAVQTSEHAEIISKYALIRAKFLENLSTQIEKRFPVNKECCFLTGLFSLLDVMVNVSMETALKDVPISEESREAILSKSGTMGHMLNIIKSLEASDCIEAFSSAYVLGLKDCEINANLQSAIEWADSIEI